MEINDFEIVWMYVMDSGKWPRKRSDIREIAEMLIKKVKSVEGIIRYYTATELEQRAGSKEKKADIRVKNEDIKEILEIWYDSDYDNVDPEYLENLQFFRAKMVPFEMVLPGDRIAPVDVRLMFHSSGNFIIEFSLKIKDMAITPEIVNELQLLPRAEEELTVKIPRKLMKDYALINPESAVLAGKGSEDENKPITINFTFHEIAWIYWAVIAFLVTGEKAKDSRMLHRSLRYNVFHFFPILIFNFPEILNLETLFEKYKPELYSMITQEIYLKPEFLRQEDIDELFNATKNQADRKDYGMFFSLESAMLLYTQESKPAQQFIVEKRKITMEKQQLFEKYDFLLVLEFLQLQYFMLMMYDFILSRKKISEMEPDDLSQMRGRLSKAIEEFYNIKLAVKTITIKRLENGGVLYKLENSLAALEKKLEIIDAAVSSIHGNLMEFLSILLGILITIGPIVALAVAQDVAVLPSIIASSITFGVLVGIFFLYKGAYRIWYKRRKV